MSATVRSSRLVRSSAALRPALAGKTISLSWGLSITATDLSLFGTARTRSSALGPASVAAASSLLWNGRGIPSQVSALAILLPHQRSYSTEQQTQSSSQSYPPPGFNAEQAKKPTPQDQAQPSKAASQPPATKSDVAPASKAPASQAAVKQATAEKNVAEEKKETKKLTIGQKIKKEVQHYWDGTKLLATEVKISSRLALKMAAGYELSRREHRQVCP